MTSTDVSSSQRSLAVLATGVWCGLYGHVERSEADRVVPPEGLTPVPLAPIRGQSRLIARQRRKWWSLSAWRGRSSTNSVRLGG